jgi:5-formaminoimidazole-4-carboxamide-1-beta-D-ribofuranosyl 5'-monophosphate synthetase
VTCYGRQAGRRIARDLKQAIETGKLEEVLG